MHARRRAAALLLIMALMTLLAGSGCGKQPTEPGAGPGVAAPETAPGSSSVTPPTGVATPAQRPAPYSGKGLADPYINDSGEIELVFADARGTVTVGAGKGRITTARLSQDRMRLAYVATEGSADLNEGRVYILDASVDPWREVRTDYRDWAICELAFSPCGEYLSADSGTSVVRGVAVVRAADGKVVASAGVYCGTVWSPEAPSRLAMGMMTNRPLAPLTELDRTVDTVILELPSGRLRYIRRGTSSEFWAPLKWIDNRRIELGHTTILPVSDSTETVEVPAPLTGFDDLPAGTGPLPAGVAAQPEVNVRRELLLTGPDGTLLRRLTDAGRGSVIDFAVSGDGRILAYAWLANGEDSIRLFTVSLPDLATTEIPLGPAPAGVHGWGPKQLSFAPGSRPLLLADWQGRARVYDCEGRTLLAEFDAEWPVWVPWQLNGSEPRVLFGQYVDASPLTNPLARASLVMYSADTGATTVLIPATDTVGHVPLEFADDGTVKLLRTGAGEMEFALYRLPE